MDLHFIGAPGSVSFFLSFGRLLCLVLVYPGLRLATRVRIYDFVIISVSILSLGRHFRASAVGIGWGSVPSLFSISFL